MDRGISGVYDPEDFGNYIKFRYTMVTEDYFWQDPWSDNPLLDPTFALMGYDMRSRRYQFERNEGFKEIRVPYLAETKTHIAVFDPAKFGERSDGRSGRFTDALMLSFNPFLNNTFRANTFLSPAALSTLASQVNVTPEEGELFLLPLGYAQQLGLDRDESIRVEFKGICSEWLPCLLIPGCEDPWLCERDPACHNQYIHEFSRDLIYKGSTQYLGYDNFYVASTFNPDPHNCPGPIILKQIEIDGVLPATNQAIAHGHTYLKSIRLFDRQTYDLLAGTPTVLDPLNIVNLSALRDAQDYLMKVAFDYDYSLGRGMPNSIATQSGNGGADARQGRLTLKAVRFFSRAGIQGNQGYRFGYYDPPVTMTLPPDNRQIEYTEHYAKDPWGYFSSLSKNDISLVDPHTLPASSFFDDDPYFSNARTPVQAMWSLKNIDTPVGTRIAIEYEADRYTYVQDRLAVVGNALHAQGTGVAPLLSLDTDDVNVFWPSGGSPSHQEFVAELQSHTLNPDQNHWSKQVVVSMLHPNEEDYDRFIIPIEPLTEGYRLVDHAALRDLYIVMAGREKIDGEYCPDPQGCPKTVLVVRGIPADASDNPLLADHYAANAYLNDVYQLTSLAGELGGGLRVKALTLAEDQGPIEDGDYHRMAYTYLDPETGLDSGVIFTDPPRAGQNLVASETRVVRADLYPYLNFPGAEVIYETVTVSVEQPNQAGSDYGKTFYRFQTARDAIVRAPLANFDSGTGAYIQREVEHSDIQNFTNISYTDYGAYQFKDKFGLGSGIHWEIARIGPVVFTLDSEIRKFVLNNTALIGAPKLTRSYQNINDPYDKPLTETSYHYAGNFQDDALTLNPDLESNVSLARPLLKSFDLGQGSEAWQLNETSLDTKSQGVFREKSQSLLIRSADIDDYHGRIFLIDEISNTFRQAITISHEFRYDGNNNAIENLVKKNEILALDYWTGNPALTRESLERDGITRHLYNLVVAAHQLGRTDADPVDDYWNPNHPQSLRNRHMLTQDGFALSAMSVAELGQTQIEAFLNTLETASGIEVLEAAYSQWNRPFPNGDEPVHSWTKDTTYRFLHQTAAKDALGWRYPPLDSRPSGALLNLEVAVTLDNEGEGHWLAPGQNTRYDRDLNVLEYRDLDNSFSTARYIHDNRLVAVNFIDAQFSQTFYEGFEDDDSAHHPTFSDSPDAADYLANFQHVYVGGRSHIGDYQTNLTLENAYATEVTDNRDEYWVSFYVKETETVTLNNTLIDDLSNLTGIRLQEGLLLQRVDNNWILIRKRFNSAPTSLAIDLGSDSGYLDEIAIYPATQATQNNSAHRAKAGCSIFGYHPHHRQVISITDERGRTIRFQYNPKGVLFRTYDIESRIQTKHNKSYQPQNLGDQ